MNAKIPYGTFTVGAVGIEQKNTPQGVSLTGYVMSGTLTPIQWKGWKLTPLVYPL